MKRDCDEEYLRSAKKIRFAGRVFYIFDYVYEPAEDTFLIAKHLKVDGFILDVGTGCGILSVLAASKAKHIVAVDINPYAARCAKINAEVNGVSDKIDILIGDLFNPIHENLTFDTILFNAPYLPDEKRKESKSLIEYAWSGGKDGREVIDRFIQQAPKYLKPYGRILLVQSSLSDVEKTIREFRKRRLQARIIDEEKIFFETISLIEALNLRKF